MTIQKQFQLRFFTVEQDGGYKLHLCEHVGNNNDYHFVASILGMLDPVECEYINEEIEKAQNGLPFEQEHGPDTLSDHHHMLLDTSNIVTNLGKVTIPIEDWKKLMEEWIEFCS